MPTLDFNSSLVKIQLILERRIDIFAIVSVRNYLKKKAGWIFLHGTGDKEQESLKEESAAFGDILQGNIPDTYPYLSYKVIMSFIWINK